MPSTATWPAAGRAAVVAVGTADSFAARSRSPNSLRAVPSSFETSRASWPKPLTTRTPVTVSSTCCATSAARCCADHVAGNRRLRLRVTTMPTAGVTTSAISVSTGDIHSIAANDSSAKITEPNDSGTCIRIPTTSCRSEIARETTWPVRKASCLPPSSRETALKTRWRRSCWTSRASFPPKYRRRNAVANATSCNATRKTAIPRSATGLPGHRVVHRRAHQQRARGLHADAEHGGEQRQHDERAVLPGRGGQPADPADGLSGWELLTGAGRSDGHVVNIKRRHRQNISPKAVKAVSKTSRRPPRTGGTT